MSYLIVMSYLIAVILEQIFTNFEMRIKSDILSNTLMN